MVTWKTAHSNTDPINAMTKYPLFLTLPLFVALGFFLAPEHQNRADKILDERLRSWQMFAPEEMQLRLHTDPIIQGIVLWDQDKQRIFPAIDQMAHFSQQPYLADLKQLEGLRDEADPISTEVKSKNGEIHYWCQSEACLIINGPALAEALGVKPEDHKTIFETASFNLLYLVAITLITGLGIFRCRHIRHGKRTRLSPEDHDAFDFGPVRISPARMSAVIGTHSSDLTPRDLKLILKMRSHQGFVLSKDQLYDAGWGRDFMPNSRALEQHMLTLRRKLDPDRNNRVMIETVHGQGYRFNG